MYFSLADIEKAAQQRMPLAIYDFYAGGAGDEFSLKSARRFYEELALIPRILIDVSTITTHCSILQESLNSPILIAPTAYHGLAHPDAEKAVAKASKTTDTLMIASCMANTSLEEIARIDSARWFQFYIFNNRDYTLKLINRAEQSGYSALVLTVDTHFLGIRERDLRNSFNLPAHLSLPNLQDLLQPIKVSAGSQDLFCKNATWDDIKWLKQNTSLPIFLKGILHPRDAEQAVKCDISGIIVSNHGGRQLDTTVSPLLILPEIKKIIHDRIPILIDGGIRRGTDIIKALALGADAILIGRPILWGLAVNGYEGVQQVINILKTELINAMGLCGLTSIDAIKKNGIQIIRSNDVIK